MRIFATRTIIGTVDGPATHHALAQLDEHRFAVIDPEAPADQVFVRVLVDEGAALEMLRGWPHWRAPRPDGRMSQLTAAGVAWLNEQRESASCPTGVKEVGSWPHLVIQVS
jgi:hypothetical protein